MPRQFFAIRAALTELGKLNGGPNGALAQKIDQVREKGHVLPVADFLAHVAVVEFIMNQACG